MFLNGRYIRYVHIPDEVDIVTAVNTRVLAQKDAAGSHRRTADVIREANERRERMRTLQMENVAAAIAELGVEASQLGGEISSTLAHFVPGAKPPNWLQQ